MRRLGYTVGGLLVLLALGAVLAAGWQRWQGWRVLAPARNAGLDERVLFAPRAGRALAFNTATHQGWFALQGFVVARADARRKGLPITLEIELRGARGRALATERRYLALPPSNDVQAYGLLDGRARELVWILPTEWFDLSARPDVRAIAARIVDAGPGVQAVLWRGAIDMRLSDTQTRLRYRRLGDDARDALTRDWVTPASLVHPRQKQELVRYRQKRIGPLGQAGVDFDAYRVLRQVPRTRPRRFDPRIAAMPITPDMPVSFELAQERELTIDARAADGAALPVALWSSAARPRTLETGQARATWRAGIYEVRSMARGTVDIRDAATGDPVVPDGLRPRAHRSQRDLTLRYRLLALGNAPPPVRIRARAEQVGARASLNVRFLDASGAELQSHALDIPAVASRHDRRSDALDRPAAEPAQVDLQPPALARLVELRSDAAVLSTLYTTIPQKDGAPRARALRRWFSFLPEVDPRSVLSQGVVVIEQPRLAAARGAVASDRAEGVPAVDDVPGERGRGGPPRIRLRLRRADAPGVDDEDA